MAGTELKADMWVSEYMTPWDIYVHGVSKILAYQKTAYQEMYIVESGAYGKALILDGKWQSCTGDEFIYHEALVHPAMIAQKTAENVLVLGGGEGATIREVLRWQGVKQVMMVDIDGEVVAACREHLPEMHQNAFDDPRVELVIADALQVLDKNKQKWDVICSDLSDPIESGPSFALFTQEYYQKLQQALAPGGIVVIQAGPVAPANLQLHARLVKTLQSVFPNTHAYLAPTPTYGSPWGFVLASEQKIDSRPDPQAVDELLAAQTTGDLRAIDGVGLLGMLNTPRYIRQAIASETQIYTLKQPPKFFGQGVKQG